MVYDLNITSMNDMTKEALIANASNQVAAPIVIIILVFLGFAIGLGSLAIKPKGRPKYFSVVGLIYILTIAFAISVLLMPNFWAGALNFIK